MTTDEDTPELISPQEHIAALEARIKVLERERDDLGSLLSRLSTLHRRPNAESLLPGQVDDYLSRHGFTEQTKMWTSPR